MEIFCSFDFRGAVAKHNEIFAGEPVLGHPFFEHGLFTEILRVYMALDTAVTVADEIEQFSFLADLSVRVAAEDQRLQTTGVKVLQEGAAAVDDQLIRRRFAGA